MINHFMAQVPEDLSFFVLFKYKSPKHCTEDCSEILIKFEVCQIYFMNTVYPTGLNLQYGSVSICLNCEQPSLRFMFKNLPL